MLFLRRRLLSSLISPLSPPFLRHARFADTAAFAFFLSSDYAAELRLIIFALISMPIDIFRYATLMILPPCHAAAFTLAATPY